MSVREGVAVNEAGGSREHHPPGSWQAEWLGTPEWELARRLHNWLCDRGHQSDQCWGLSDPWGLKQQVMPHDFRNWTSRALRLIEVHGSVHAANAWLDAGVPPQEQHPLWGPWSVPSETPHIASSAATPEENR